MSKEVVSSPESSSVMLLCSLRDTIARVSGPVFEAKNLGVALRSVRKLITDNELSVADYVLLVVGSYDHDNDVCVGYGDDPSVIDIYNEEL